VGTLELRPDTSLFQLSTEKRGSDGGEVHHLDCRLTTTIVEALGHFQGLAGRYGGESPRTRQPNHHPLNRTILDRGLLGRSWKEIPSSFDRTRSSPGLSSPSGSVRRGCNAHALSILVVFSSRPSQTENFYPPTHLHSYPSLATGWLPRGPPVRQSVSYSMHLISSITIPEISLPAPNDYSTFARLESISCQIRGTFMWASSSRKYTASAN
jgi:hypothetical protein